MDFSKAISQIKVNADLLDTLIVQIDSKLNNKVWMEQNNNFSGNGLGLTMVRIEVTKQNNHFVNLAVRQHYTEKGWNVNVENTGNQLTFVLSRSTPYPRVM